jgi:hypothetical protein
VTETITATTCEAAATQKTVSINALPTVASIADGVTSVCVSTTTPAFTNATSGGTWSIVPGTGTASIDGSGVVTGLTIGTVAVKYTTAADGNGCINSATKALTIHSSPATPGAISGTTPQTAAATGQTYSISAVTDASSYTWTVPDGWTITDGQGTITITVTVGNSGQDGNITVTATNACGTSSAQTMAVTVN